jgi:hypothetical protein
MATFIVTATRTIQRSYQLRVKITRDEIVDELSLEGEDRKEWREHAEDYLQNDDAKLTEAHEAGEILEVNDHEDATWEIEEVNEA